MLPPFAPAQTHWRVVPQPAWPLSLVAEPAEQPSAVALLQTPFTGQAAFTKEQVPELLPPLDPAQTHWRVVPQPDWPLSLVAEPAEQPSAAALLQTPFTGQAPLLKEQPPELLPPPDPAQTHWRLVPHALCPLSPVSMPALHPRGVALLHTPLMTQAVLL